MTHGDGTEGQAYSYAGTNRIRFKGFTGLVSQAYSHPSGLVEHRSTGAL